MTKTKIIILHGIGNQKSNWADTIVSLFPAEVQQDIIPLYYEDIRDSYLSGDKVMAANTSGFVMRLLSRLKVPIFNTVFDTLTDILDNSPIKQLVFSRLDDIITELPADTSVILLGHSMGTVILYEYLKQFSVIRYFFKTQQRTLEKVIFIGSPVFRQPIKNYLKNNTDYSDIPAPWYNYYGTNDLVTGWIRGCGINIGKCINIRVDNQGHDLVEYLQKILSGKNQIIDINN